MIPEIGHLALWLAAALAVLQLAAPFFWRGEKTAEIRSLMLIAALGQAALCLAAMAALTWAFVVSDFSVALVAAHSHTAKPALYKWTGTWANHEGSMLLWVTVLAVFGAAAAVKARTLGPTFRTRLVQVSGGIALGFYAFLLLSSNPFARLGEAPVEGRGLNPLLQDPGLAFHPPLLYLGYVGLSVTFAFAVAALFERRVDSAWARAVKPWVLVAWSFLTAGITLGSFWAYYELGWGGWWFWDPVENASLMPWLAATALFHSVSVLEKRGALKNWTILLAVTAFSLSMMGTFIVRSGLLTSVHAFAVDPERGLFLLLLLCLYVGGALALYAARAATVRGGAGFSLMSREGALIVNNLLLAAILGVVFIGTLYPLALEAMGGGRVSVGPPYFESALLPLIFPMLVLMGVGPLLRWRSVDLKRLGRRLAFPAIAGLFAAAIVLSIGLASIGTILGIALAVWLIIASFAMLGGRRLARAPLELWGTALAHLGVGIAALGITISGAASAEKIANLSLGDSLSAGPYHVRLRGVEPAAGPNYTSVRGIFEAAGQGASASLWPERRTFTAPPNETTETDIWVRPLGNLYAVIGDGDGDGKWQVRVHWQPMIALLWAGGILAAFGGLVAALGSRENKAGRDDMAKGET